MVSRGKQEGLVCGTLWELRSLHMGLEMVDGSCVH